MPVDHFILRVPQSKIEDLAVFLAASLKHMGFKEIARPMPNFIGMGEAKPYIFLFGIRDESGTESLGSLLPKNHIAIAADNAEQVRQFHAAALKAGGQDNGPPGLRAYHANYYGAFVRDPACNINFEVVCHTGDS